MNSGEKDKLMDGHAHTHMQRVRKREAQNAYIHANSLAAAVDCHLFHLQTSQFRQLIQCFAINRKQVVVAEVSADKTPHQKLSMHFRQNPTLVVNCRVSFHVYTTLTRQG